jgi:hypothetical protein
MVAQKGYLSISFVKPTGERSKNMKRQIMATSLALILVFAFAGTALAYD